MNINKSDMRKYLIRILPYLLFAYFGDKLGFTAYLRANRCFKKS